MLPRRSFLLLAVLAAAASPALPAFADESQKLFFIQRSKNADEVHYDARVGTDGNLNAKDPIDCYWLNKGTDGGKRADITFFQKQAYGYDVESTGNGTYALKLKAFKDRPMWIVKVGGRWRVQTTISGKQAYMTKLYVATKEGGVMPTVLYVDVFGEDASSGAALNEHIVKN
jgi:hypothetical protein